LGRRPSLRSQQRGTTERAWTARRRRRASQYPAMGSPRRQPIGRSELTHHKTQRTDARTHAPMRTHACSSTGCTHPAHACTRAETAARLAWLLTRAMSSRSMNNKLAPSPACTDGEVHGTNQRSREPHAAPSNAADQPTGREGTSPTPKAATDPSGTSTTLSTATPKAAATHAGTRTSGSAAAGSGKRGRGELVDGSHRLCTCGESRHDAAGRRMHYLCRVAARRGQRRVHSTRAVASGLHRATRCT
jgi:hypothetical protein